MDWLFFLLDAIVFMVFVSALVILATAGGLMLANFIGKGKPFLHYTLPLVAGLMSFGLSSPILYNFILSSIPSGRWLYLLIAALLIPLAAPLVWEALRYLRRELGIK
jgi:hypothetical protein